MSSELPEGWDGATLGQCVDVLDNKRVPVNSQERAQRQGQIPYYGATGQVGWIDDHLFDEELVLLGEDGAPFLDKSKSIAYIVQGKSWVNNHAHVLRARSSLTSNRFIKYSLDATRFDEIVNGTTRLKLTQGAMVSIPVPLPPLPEQDRIVEKVEALHEQVNRAKERLDRVPLILKRFRQAVLAAACSGELTRDWRTNIAIMEDGPALLRRLLLREERRRRYRGKLEIRQDLELPEIPVEWAWADLRFLSEPSEALCYGVVQPGEDASDGVPLVRAGDLHDLVGSISSLRRISKEIDVSYKRSRLRGGEVLITVVGANIGTATLAPPQVRDFNIARAVVKVPIREIDAEFVLLWLRSALAYRWMFGDAREVARPTLNIEQLETLPVPIPPLVEQAEVVRQAKALLSLAAAIERRVERGTAQAEKLSQAIISKAFSGELVPTEAEMARLEGRTYETAEELLKRVMALGSDVSPNGKGRGRRNRKAE